MFLLWRIRRFAFNGAGFPRDPKSRNGRRKIPLVAVRRHLGQHLMNRR
jgi:hypothetical protein